jgi:hypothetical protein
MCYIAEPSNATRTKKDHTVKNTIVAVVTTLTSEVVQRGFLPNQYGTSNFDVALHCTKGPLSIHDLAQRPVHTLLYSGGQVPNSVKTFAAIEI